MTDDEVAGFGETVAIPAFLEYFEAVAGRTKEIVTGLSLSDLLVVPDEAHRRKVLMEEGNFSGDVGERVFQVRRGQARLEVVGTAHLSPLHASG